MKDEIYHLGDRSVTFPPFSQCFLKFVSCLSPFGELEKVLHVFITMYITYWELRGGPYYSFLHDCACWKLSGGKSIHQSLYGTVGIIYGEVTRVCKT